MTNCPICNRETNQDCNWCEDCLTEWKTYHSDYFYEEPPPRLIAEWAARRAREFERDRTKVLVEETIIQTIHSCAQWIKTNINPKGDVNIDDKESWDLLAEEVINLMIEELSKASTDQKDENE